MAQAKSEVMNLYQRLLKITAEMATVQKKLDVKTGNNGHYKAVSERDVMDAVKPLEEKYGVYSYPFSREIIESETFTNERGSQKYYMRIRTIYRFLNIDNSAEYIDITSYADGVDVGDKAAGKAMTYCDKYALMKAYKISTGDDPDVDGSEVDDPSKTVGYVAKMKANKYPSEADALPTELLMEIQAVRREIEGLGVDTRSDGFKKFMADNLNVHELDPARMTIAEGAKALGAMRRFAKTLADKRRKEAEKKAKKENAEPVQAEVNPDDLPF